jgi:hypothetical protein
MSERFVKRVARFVRKRATALELDKVKDPRDRRGRRWRLRSLLSAALIGLVALERSLRGVERLTRDLAGCRKALHISRRVPDTTLASLLTRLDDEDGLRRVLLSDIRRAERRKALEPTRLRLNVVAIDGQTIWCGKKLLDDPACQAMPQEGRTYYRLHMLHAVLVSAASQPCLDQMAVPAETNEMGAFATFFSRLLATYRRSSLLDLLSVDAGMTSAEHAQLIDRANIGYMMAVKETQPTLLREMERLCGQGDKKQPGYVCEAATPWELYKGKRIRRELYRSAEIAGWPGWQSVRQAWRVKQTTRHPDGREEVENRYFVTNLPWGRLKGRDILALVRLHWGIENGCHWTLDVVMHEDTRPWCTKGNALRMLSWLRLIAYNMLRFLRDRYLRSLSNRCLPWDELRRVLSLTLQVAAAWKTDPEGEAEEAVA